MTAVSIFFYVLLGSQSCENCSTNGFCLSLEHSVHAYAHTTSQKRTRVCVTGVDDE